MCKCRFALGHLDGGNIAVDVSCVLFVIATQMVIIEGWRLK